MFEPQEREAFQWNEKIATVVGSLLLAGMMACLGFTLNEFGSRISPGWAGGFLPWICMAISFEAIFSEGRVRPYSLLSSGRIAYRVSEVILLTLGLKLFLTFIRGEPFLESISSWQRDFPLSFFAGEYGSLWAIMMVVWALTGFFGRLLYDLVQDTELLRPGSEPQFFTSRKETRRRLAGQMFFIGAVMVVLTALTRADIEAIWGDLPPVPTHALNILIYFFLAFILLSQGQFAVLRAGWIWQHIPVTRPMALGWLRYSLFFLGILALLVLILPTGYSLSLLTLTKILFSFIFGIINLIFLLILLPIYWLINFLARQRGEAAPFENPLESLRSPLEAEAATPIATLPISELVKSTIFWGIFLFVCGYALVQYLRQNKELLERLRRIPGLRWILDGVNSFLVWLRGATRTVTQMAAAGWERIRPQPRGGTATAPWRLIRPNRMTPREQVRFYYLALLRRTQENGLPRAISQTPQEYSAELAHLLPEQSPDVTALTDAFVEARYTTHPIPEETAGKVKAIWEHLRSLFKK